MDFLIVYERKIRELENAVLLKLELERRGYSCVIYNIFEGDEFNICNLKPPEVILVPQLYETKYITRIFARFGVAKKIVNLQYEQVLSDLVEEIGLHNPKGEAKKAMHICWGNSTQNRLIKAGIEKDNTKVLGALQLDLLRNEYREESATIKNSLAEEFNLDINKRWVLFISSFTYADIPKEKLKLNEAITRTNLTSIVKIHDSSRNKILEWLKKILEKDSESILIYRPHPDEYSLEKVYKLQKIYPNFKVIRKCPVKLWIESAAHIYTWYSTSVIEAHFTAKPYSIVRPIELTRHFDSVILRDAKFIKSYEEFIEDYVKLDSKREPAISDHYIKEYYDEDKERPAFKRYSDELEKIYKSNMIQNYKLNKLEKISSKLKAVVLTIVHKIYKKLNLNLEKYRLKKEKSYLINLFIEMEDQIAKKAEIELIKKKLEKQVFGKY